MLDVFLDHAASREARRHRAYGLLHQLDPAPRHVVRVARVIKRNDFFGEHAVEVLRVDRVVVLDHLLALLTKRPAVAAAVAFVPPTIEHGEMRHAVQPRLLAARAACFHRRARRVEPHVDTGDHELGDVEVVVVDERDARPEPSVERLLVHLADEVFTRLVRGVGLTGEDDLQRTPGVLEHAEEPLDVMEDQRGPLVRREAPREADGERLGVEQRAGREQLCRFGEPADPAQAGAFADQPDEGALQLEMDAPELVVANAHQIFPERGLVVAREPVRTECPGEECGHPRRHPRRDVNAVRHRGDRHLIFAAIGKHAAPHPPRDLAVELAHRVAQSRRSQREHGHVEALTGGKRRKYKKRREGGSLVLGESEALTGGKKRRKRREGGTESEALTGGKKRRKRREGGAETEALTGGKRRKYKKRREGGAEVEALTGGKKRRRSRRRDGGALESQAGEFMPMYDPLMGGMQMMPAYEPNYESLMGGFVPPHPQLGGYMQEPMYFMPPQHDMSQSVTGGSRSKRSRSLKMPAGASKYKCGPRGGVKKINKKGHVTHVAKKEWHKHPGVRDVCKKHAAKVKSVKRRAAKRV